MNKLRQLTTERLATLLHEELDRDDWGEIDPYLFKVVGGIVLPGSTRDEAEALGKVLDRVVARLKEEP